MLPLQTNNDLVNKYLPEIFENEASGIIQDIMATPALIAGFMMAEEEEIHRVKEYVRNIFVEMYRGRNITVNVICDGDTLVGYSLIFIHNDKNIAAYCHKIFVYKPYRNKGLGSALVKQVLNQTNGLGLICQHNLVPFYEKLGMKYAQDFFLPENTNFDILGSIYNGLAVVTYKVVNLSSTPVFILNDEDAKEIIKLLVNK